MAQLHFYVPDEVAESIRRQAARCGLPVSRYLAELVRREVTDRWPDDYAEQVFGCWQGEPLERPGQGPFEQRVEL